MTGIRRGIAAGLACGGAVLAAGSPAGALPTNNDYVLVFTANCVGEPTPIDLMVIGGGWAPAHRVDGHGVFIPQAFNLASTFTPVGGAPQTQVDTRTKSKVAADAVACNLTNQTFTFPAKGKFPGGTLVLNGTVTGVFRGGGSS